MKYLWSHRNFIIGGGWQDWSVREVEITAETELYYKIHYTFGIVPLVDWVLKNSNANKFERIKDIT